MDRVIKMFVVNVSGLMLIAASGSVWAIKKCKDADGNWHYGDVADSACAKSKVTTLNDRGFIENELDAPKTAEQIKAEQDALAVQEAEAARLVAIEEERNRVLGIYETEEDIDRQRDNQINSVQGSIDVHKAYLKNLDKRIARYQEDLSETDNTVTQEKISEQMAAAEQRKQKSLKNLSALEAQKEQIIKRFENEKAIYRKLKNS